jgi:hypothetical protein
LDPDTEAAAIRRRNPHLAAAFEGREAVLLFLDGHNMLNGMGRYRTQRGKPQTHEDARKQVEKDIQHSQFVAVQVKASLLQNHSQRAEDALWLKHYVLDRRN